jgi:hypothetical protein
MTMISGPQKLWIRAALIPLREVVSVLLSILLCGRLL